MTIVKCNLQYIQKLKNEFESEIDKNALESFQKSLKKFDAKILEIEKKVNEVNDLVVPKN